MIFSAVSVICIAGLGLADKLELPVTTCKRNSSDYSTCLLHAVQEAWPRFVTGLPEFDFPPLDPFFIDHAKGAFDASELHGELTAINLTARGLKNNHITDVRTHLADDVFRVEIDFALPRLSVRSYIVAEGRLGPFAMKGKGKFNMTALDIRGTYDLMGHVSNDTWTVERFLTRPSVKMLKVFVNDIFDVAEMNKLTTDFINEYWPPIYRGMLPVMSDIWESWLIDLVNRVFSKVSFSAIFP